MKIKVLVLLLVLSVVLAGGFVNAADVVSSPSVVVNEDTLQNTISEVGTWIVIFQEDIVTDQELILEGEFVHRDEVYRKVALYDQDEDRNKTVEYTLEAPKLTIRSENTRLQGGIFVGDIYVEANGFELVDMEIEGNVYFANEEVKSTFSIDKATITGVLE